MKHGKKSSRNALYIVGAIIVFVAFFAAVWFVQTRSEPTVKTVEQKLLSLAHVSQTSDSPAVVDIAKSEDMMMLDIDTQSVDAIQEYVGKMADGTGSVVYAQGVDAHHKQVYLAIWYDVDVSNYSISRGQAGSITLRSPSRQGALRVWLVDSSGTWLLRDAYADPAFESSVDAEKTRATTYLAPRLFNVSEENEKKLILRY